MNNNTKLFAKVRPFTSKKAGKEGDKIFQVKLNGQDTIIVIPDNLKDKIHLGVVYDLECNKMNKGNGYVVKKFKIHVPLVEVKLSPDKRNISVIVDGKIQSNFCYDLAGKLTPHEFYESRKYIFTSEVSKQIHYFTIWYQYLQDISIHWEINDWPRVNLDDISIIEVSVSPLELNKAKDNLLDYINEDSIDDEISAEVFANWP